MASDTQRVLADAARARRCSGVGKDKDLSGIGKDIDLYRHDRRYLAPEANTVLRTRDETARVPVRQGAMVGPCIRATIRSVDFHLTERQCAVDGRYLDVEILADKRSRARDTRVRRVRRLLHGHHLIGGAQEVANNALTWCSGCTKRPCAFVSMRQHAPAYVSIRQHTSAYVSNGLTW